MIRNQFLAFTEKALRYQRLDNFKGLLILLVVIGHFLLPILDSSRVVNGLFYVIYVFHMPAMVMVSGFFSRSVIKNGQFQWKKLLRLLVLYLIFEGIVFLTEKLAYPDYKTEGFFLLYESGAPWYLMSMIFWYLTVPVARLFRRYPKSVFFVAGLTVVIVFARYFVQPGDFLSLDRTIAFAPFFYIGYFYSKKEMERYCHSPLHYASAAMALFALFAVYIGASGVINRYSMVVYGADYNRYPADLQPKLWLINICWYAIALTITLGILGLCPNRRVPVLTQLGKNSLQIYILHRPIRDLLIYFGLFRHIDPGNGWQLLLIILLAVLLTVFLGNEYFKQFFEYIQSKMHKNA